jgi:hypothetical protein
MRRGLHENLAASQPFDVAWRARPAALSPRFLSGRILPQSFGASRKQGRPTPSRCMRRALPECSADVSPKSESKLRVMRLTPLANKEPPAAGGVTINARLARPHAPGAPYGSSEVHRAHAEQADQSDHDQIDRDDDIQQSRHDEDENARDQRNERAEAYMNGHRNSSFFVDVVGLKQQCRNVDPSAHMGVLLRS